jgi:hypothetical protein
MSPKSILYKYYIGQWQSFWLYLKHKVAQSVWRPATGATGCAVPFPAPHPHRLGGAQNLLYNGCRKWPGHEADHSLKNKFHSPLTSSWCFIKHKDNFRNRIFSVIMYEGRGARGSVVGWGTMLQAGRSRVPFPMRSLNISIYQILMYTRGSVSNVHSFI